MPATGVFTNKHCLGKAWVGCTLIFFFGGESLEPDDLVDDCGTQRALDLVFGREYKEFAAVNAR